ncbi:MAG: hypothetical protein ACH6QM_00880 [Candidatus Carsonella ruddii]
MFKKKIVLAYSGLLIEYLLIKYLISKNIEIICFINYINLKTLTFLKKKLKNNNIKKIFFKKTKYIFNKIIFNLKFNFYYKLKKIKQKIINFLIIKELLKISFYFKTNYLFYKNNNKIFIKYLFYFNKNLKIFKFNFNKKKILLIQKIKIIKKKNIINNIFLNSVNYCIYITITFKNGNITKINNIEYNKKDILLKINNITKIHGINYKNCSCYNYLKIINFIKNKFEKKKNNNKYFLIKKILIEKYLKNIFNKENLNIFKIINYIDNILNGLIKIKILKGKIKILNFKIYN